MSTVLSAEIPILKNIIN